MIAEDPSIFFEEFGVNVVFGSITASGLLDSPTEVIGGRGFSNQYRLQYVTAELPGLVRGSAITVDGDAYTLREDTSLLGDGVMSEAMLTKS